MCTHTVPSTKQGLCLLTASLSFVRTPSPGLRGHGPAPAFLLAYILVAHVSCPHKSVFCTLLPR